MENKTCAIIGGEFGFCTNDFFQEYEQILITLLKESKINTFKFIKSEFSLLSANILQSLKSVFNFNIEFYTCDKTFKDKIVKNFFKKIFDKIIYVNNSNDLIITEDCINNSDITLLCFDKEKTKLKTLINYCNEHNKKFIDILELIK